jgi:hypothetical protein
MRKQKRKRDASHDQSVPSIYTLFILHANACNMQHFQAAAACEQAGGDSLCGEQTWRVYVHRLH